MSVLLVEGPLSVVLQSIRGHAVSIGVYTHAYWTTAVTSVVWGALVRLRDLIEQEDVCFLPLHFSSNNFVVHDVLRIFSLLVLVPTFAPPPLAALFADVSKSENHEVKLSRSSRRSMDTIDGGSVLLWLWHGDRLECPNVMADGITAVHSTVHERFDRWRNLEIRNTGRVAQELCRQAVTVTGAWCEWYVVIVQYSITWCL